MKTDLLDGDEGTITIRCEYGPFGEVKARAAARLIAFY
jgi:hypothetical protein